MALVRERDPSDEGVTRAATIVHEKLGPVGGAGDRRDGVSSPVGSASAR